MTGEKQSSSIESVLTGFKLGLYGIGIYLLYRFVRPYWYFGRIAAWLTDEQDYIKDYSRSLHPLGFYEFEVHLTEGPEPDLFIENTSRRVPVIIRAEREFDPGVRGNLLDRQPEDERNYALDEQRQFFEEIEWALNSAPGVYGFTDHQGESCAAEDAASVTIEYRIYPDAVSQHEILNSIFEIANTFKLIGQREQKYTDRLNSNR